MKKNLLKLSILLILGLFPLQALAEYQKLSPYEDFTSWYLRESGREIKPYTASALIDAETLEPLHYHAEEQPIPTASLVKIFTAKTLLLYPQNWSELLTFTNADNETSLRPHVNPEDIIPIIRMQAGDTLTRLDAFAGMLIASANNAPYALARTVAFSLDEFVAVMNATVKDLGMTNTHLVEPSGLSLENMSTAKDLVQGGCQVYREEMIKKYAGYSYYKFNTTQQEEKIFSHTLYSLRYDLDYSVYTAAKTGYLDETGYHVMAEMKTPKGKTVCAVILGADSRARLDEMLLAMRLWLDEMYL